VKKPKTLGQIAYDEWHWQFIGTWGDWSEVSKHSKRLWALAARAVEREVLRRIKREKHG